jgi:hypothetical protein
VSPVPLNVWVETSNGDFTFAATFTGDHLVECFGIGGDGQTAAPPPGIGGGGGGGGGYAASVLALVSGTNYPVHIGGIPRDVTFDTPTVIARSGNDGGAEAGGGGGGGAFTGPNVGDVTHLGGDGANGLFPVGDGGGGGGGAGPTGDGQNATGNAGGAGEGVGGDGGAGALTTGANGVDGSAVGGGGGGNADGGGSAGAGSHGLVRITWPWPP